MHKCPHSYGIEGSQRDWINLFLDHLLTRAISASDVILFLWHFATLEN